MVSLKDSTKFEKKKKKKELTSIIHIVLASRT